MSKQEFMNVALIDMDGPMAMFDEEVTRRMTEHHPDIQPLDQETPHFYTALNYAPEHRQTVWDISNEPGFIRSLPVTPGAIQGWARLIDQGITPQVCSTPLPEAYYPTCVTEKKDWLEEHFVPVFGSWVIKSALFTKEKHRESGFMLLDDRPAPMPNANLAVWEHVIFDRPCNRTAQAAGHVRIEGWQDPHFDQKIATVRERQTQR